MNKDRIILLQKQLSIAKRALERLAFGHDHTGIASEALDSMMCVEMGKTHAATNDKRRSA